MEYGLLGGQLSHSVSPMIHRILAGYDYRLYPMDPKGMDTALRERSFRGLNVTIPYKQAVLKYCDELSDEVQRTGSANTLVNRNGHVTAWNTDLKGFEAMLAAAHLSPSGKKAVILGSGGTAGTARAVCEALGAGEIVTVSRSGPVDYSALYRNHTDAELLVNATPVGMAPGAPESPVDLSRFRHLAGVAEVVYNPCRTALALDAQERGIPCTDPLIMLCVQAWHSARLFLDANIPESRLREALDAVRKQLHNLVLIGMPGCGKTTLGSAIAARLGRPFADLDEDIEKLAGKPIPRIFSEDGENAFRDLEERVTAGYRLCHGMVIATGGGTVLRSGNVRALRQNGIVIRVLRDVDLLSSAGRPLSVSREALRRMEEERSPMYAACADSTIENNGSIEQAVERIREAFDEITDPERTQSEPARQA